MKRPRISMIMPCFNAEKYIHVAIESILQQNYPNLELLVIDDGSTDESARIIQSFGKAVTYYYQPNAGMSPARNVGIRAATGDWIGFLDADDILMPETLNTYWAVTTASPTVEMVWGRMKIYYEEGAQKINKRLQEDEAIHSHQLGCLFCKQVVFTKIGLFDERLYRVEDLDWFKRAIDVSISIQKIEHVSVLYRRHATNVTNQMSEMKQLLQVFKNTIDRQRKR